MKNRNKQTKFPVARIKRIMQKDEDVGKVAQATPVVISKALELFLARLVKETQTVTAERSSKKLEPYHLKHAIERTELLDFLREITSNVPDPSQGGTVTMDEDGETKKRKPRAPKGKGKKVKNETDEDDTHMTDDD
ncbi:histone-fold-containing protein [Auriculariales sp. MPI-PUGE-AT-0066]|nr:histone-fold-containing protein [Auriculariales sp. MPI-PUGE-AT-0066]